MKRKKVVLLFIIIVSIFLIEGCKKREIIEERKAKEKENQTSGNREVKTNTSLEKKEIKMNVDEKGYDLPISDKEKKEAEKECNVVMNKIKSIYKNADKGDFFNVVISSQTAKQMLDVLKKAGYTVFSSEFYLNMSHYEKMEHFLKESLAGKKAETVIYEIHSSGSIGRRKFIFDGKDMYELYTNTTWSEENTPIITLNSYSRIKQWSYTKKGWFIFEYCVPEPPEVTEIVYGNAMIRVKPIKEEYLELAMKYIIPIGYQGNNLLFSDWSAGKMEKIDYNAIFQYLYSLKYQQEFNSSQYSNGIPKEEFERVIMEYLPVTAEQIEQYAVFDIESQTYKWEMLGCGNYSPGVLEVVQPEITNIKENKDGTTTLMIDVVCMLAESDAAIRHQLTVQFLENGGIRYLENKIIDYELEQIPVYQYRMKE